MRTLDEIRDAETAARPRRDGLGLIAAGRLRGRAAAPCRHVSPGLRSAAASRSSIAPLSRRESVNTVYLTVKDIPVPGTPDPIAAKVGSMFKPRHTAGLRTHANHVELRPEEIGALAKSFPSLKSTIEANPNLFAEVHSAAPEINRAVEVQADEWTERVARVEAVEASDAGTILTRENAITQTFIGVVTGLGGFALALAPPASSPRSITSRPTGSLAPPWSGCSGVCCSISAGSCASRATRRLGSCCDRRGTPSSSAPTPPSI